MTEAIFGLVGIVLGLTVREISVWSAGRRTNAAKARAHAAAYLAALDLLIKRIQLELRWVELPGAGDEQRTRVEFVDLWARVTENGYGLMAARPRLVNELSTMLGRLDWLITPVADLDYAGEHDVVAIRRAIDGEQESFHEHRNEVVRLTWGTKTARGFGLSQGGTEMLERVNARARERP